MPEFVPEFNVREYGSDVISGMPHDQTLRWKETIYLGICILEENEPIGNQHLKTEDIIELIQCVPNNIRKHISSIVLTPFIHPYEGYFNTRRGKNVPALASADYVKRQITIYTIQKDRGVLKDMLARQFTLSHEAGHIIDAIIQPRKWDFLHIHQDGPKHCAKIARLRKQGTIYHYILFHHMPKK